MWGQEVQAELDALSAMYGEGNVIANAAERKVVITGLRPVNTGLEESSKESTATFDVVVSIPMEYPDDKSPFHIEILVPWLDTTREGLLVQQAIEKTWKEGFDEQKIIQAVLHLCENVPCEPQQAKGLVSAPSKPAVSRPTVVQDDDDVKGRTQVNFPTPITIFHGEAIVDRKSVFQPHMARVSTMAEVKVVVDRLLEINRISRATHNIVAYRIKIRQPSSRDNFLVHKDHDSDGESGAGSNMQWLLETLGVLNVVVMVSRWYGGVKLGPDRFRHINNAARRILEQHYKDDNEACGSLSKRGKQQKLGTRRE